MIYTATTENIWELFHAMWNDAKTQRSYVKGNWMALQSMLKQCLEGERLPTKASIYTPLPEGARRYRTLLIEPKRDFGGQPHLINGKMVMKGWVVTDGNAQMFWEIMQPFQHTPGDRDKSYISPALGADHKKGRHYAKYERDLCVEVGILKEEVYA
jgi:hypothetical protein